MKKRIARSVEQELRETNTAELGSQHLIWSPYHGRPNLFFLVLIVALFGSSFMFSYVFATGVEHESEESFPTSISQTVSYDANDAAPVFAEQITDEHGNQYNLSDASKAYPAPGVEHYRSYTATIELPVAVTIENAPESLIRPAFDETLAINEGGFRGYINLVSIEANPVYVSYERVVDKTLKYTGLPSADISALPTAHSFLVSSDEYIGASCNKQLERLGVTTEITARDADGRPIEYQATVTFRGLESFLVIDHYQAIAYYRGDVPSVANMVCVDLTYSLVPVPVPVTTATVAPVVVEPQAVPDALPENAKPNLAYLLLLLSSTVIIVIVMIPLLYYRRRADARLITTEEDGSERTLLKRRLKIEQHLSETLDLSSLDESPAENASLTPTVKLAVFMVPENFSFNPNDSDCSLLLRGGRYQKADFVDIRFRGKLIFRARPVARLDVAKAMLAATTDSILVVETDPMVSYRESCQKG
jgi:hypothetical protein